MKISQNKFLYCMQCHHIFTLTLTDSYFSLIKDDCNFFMLFHRWSICPSLESPRCLWTTVEDDESVTRPVLDLASKSTDSF